MQMLLTLLICVPQPPPQLHEGEPLYQPPPQLHEGEPLYQLHEPPFQLPFQLHEGYSLGGLDGR